MKTYVYHFYWHSITRLAEFLDCLTELDITAKDYTDPSGEYEYAVEVEMTPEDFNRMFKRWNRVLITDASEEES